MVSAVPAVEFPEQSPALEAFAGQYFNRLNEWGAERRRLEPLVTCDGPGIGNVLWRTPEGTLRGYNVSTLNASAPGISREDFAAIGFDAKKLEGGIWVLNDAQVHSDEGGQPVIGSSSNTFAHYDGTTWTVVRARDDALSQSSWLAQWNKPTDELSDGEKGAIRRIIDVSQFVQDAAIASQGMSPSVAADSLKSIMADRAQQAGGDAPANLTTIQRLVYIPNPIDHVSPHSAAILATLMERYYYSSSDGTVTAREIPLPPFEPITSIDSRL